MRTMDVVEGREYLVRKILGTAAWDALAESVRAFDPDVAVLVARKMPRLVEVLKLDLGREAMLVSDHAIPFIYDRLKNARVAIVDDVWNVGTTMLRAQERVRAASPKVVKMFALGAKTDGAEAARTQGVHLAMVEPLNEDQHQRLVDAVPQALRLSAKPYDVDFPISPCSLRAPFGNWDECWRCVSAGAKIPQ